MSGMKRLLLLSSAALLLAGCGRADDDPGVGAVTAGEARALNEAAEMLDKTMPPPTPMPQGRSPGAPPDNALGAGQPAKPMVNHH